MTHSPIKGDTNVFRVLDRVSTAMDLYRDGHTWEEIAEVVGFASRGAAHSAVMTYMREHVSTTAVEMRAIEDRRMNADELRLRQIIADPTVPPGIAIRAVDARTRLSARRARLHGLDAPVQVQISAGVRAELEDALGELSEILGEVVPGVVVASTDEPGVG